MTQHPYTNSSCPVCGDMPQYPHDMCQACLDQKRTVEKLRRQKKRDAAFGSPWEIAGVGND